MAVRILAPILCAMAGIATTPGSFPVLQVDPHGLNEWQRLLPKAYILIQEWKQES